MLASTLSGLCGSASGLRLQRSPTNAPGAPRLPLAAAEKAGAPAIAMAFVYLPSQTATTSPPRTLRPAFTWSRSRRLEVAAAHQVRSPATVSALRSSP